MRCYVTYDMSHVCQNNYQNDSYKTEKKIGKKPKCLLLSDSPLHLRSTFTQNFSFLIPFIVIISALCFMFSKNCYLLRFKVVTPTSTMTTLRRCVMQPRRRLPTFQRNLLPPKRRKTSDYTAEHPRRQPSSTITLPHVIYMH
jgi:hypothetical protein